MMSGLLSANIRAVHKYKKALVGKHIDYPEPRSVENRNRERQ
jgi:hypothetical protein